MKVLFIDEDETAVEVGLDFLTEKGHECKRVDFSDFDFEFQQFSPHVVVLDMMNGGTAKDATGEGGKTIFDKIWGHKFCPIVVYSADPNLIDAVDADRANHPLVEKVQKGKDSEEMLYANVQKYSACVEGISKISSEVKDALHVTLWEIAKHLVGKDGLNEADAIQYLGRRRIAALMDDSSLQHAPLVPGSKYIYPPIGDFPKLGDILFKVDAQDKPDSYCIVITPSCDLVKSRGREPNVKDILVAKCEAIEDVAKLFETGVLPSKVGKLAKALTQGYIKEFLPLPALPGEFPSLIVNLKKLELIPYKSIVTENGKQCDYKIIASIDSPFRERIAWAYLNTGSRPGVPDIDCVCWAEEYLAKETK